MLPWLLCGQWGVFLVGQNKHVWISVFQGLWSNSFKLETDKIRDWIWGAQWIWRLETNFTWFYWGLHMCDVWSMTHNKLFKNLIHSLNGQIFHILLYSLEKHSYFYKWYFAFLLGTYAVTYKIVCWPSVNTLTFNMVPPLYSLWHQPSRSAKGFQLHSMGTHGSPFAGSGRAAAWMHRVNHWMEVSLDPIKTFHLFPPPTSSKITSTSWAFMPSSSTHRRVFCWCALGKTLKSELTWPTESLTRSIKTHDNHSLVATCSPILLFLVGAHILKLFCSV